MKFLIFILFFLLGSVVQAVEPHEVLQNKFLEQRARDISKGLRCPVCQNESIDESSADLSADLRLLVRERLLEGDSDQEVVDFIVARYGEFVRLEPNLTGSNFMLWATAPFLLLIGLAMGLFFIRRQAEREKNEDDELSDNEKTKLERILNR